MSNELTNELKRELFAQESGDPFLTLVTFTSTFFTARLVNNSRDVISNGFTFTAIPMKIRLPVDDGETVREFLLEIDNITLDLIENLRSVTGDIGVKIQLILASDPDQIQIEHNDLVLRTVTYDKQKITGRIALDNFLAVEMTGERYTPTNFPGLFT